ncbi:MAG: ABC transporter ATP-binding protein [Deltaproteobacteria bacterium]|nr:MAG: ABC transporter ATP-binding protein [Deltaproteobacteria bacterium]
MRAENIYKSFGEGKNRVNVLNGINLELRPGESLTILGASGVGKSTLLHILGTLERPSSGKIYYKEEELTAKDENKLAEFRNRTIGFVFQFHHLLPEFSALENAMMPALIQGMSREEAAAKAEVILREVGLGDRFSHKPGELSGGEQQRVAVARSLILDPPLILADEPTGNLDAKTGEGIEELLLRFNREKGIALLIVTHNERLTKKMSRCILLKEGKVAS